MFFDLIGMILALYNCNCYGQKAYRKNQKEGGPYVFFSNLFVDGKFDVGFALW